MINSENIEIEMSDTIIERPVGFSLGNRTYYLYPPTLGKNYLLSRLMKNLEINEAIIVTNPYLEALRLCQEKTDLVCRIVAYSTINQKTLLFDNNYIEALCSFIKDNANVEDLATIFVLILTSDNTSKFIRYLKLDKEKEEKNRVLNVKKNNSSVSFGGRSVYGTLIDSACQKYGWTMDYVVWGISYANLVMLMADSITTIYLSEDERKELSSSNKKVINADDPNNEAFIDDILKD